MKVVIRVDASLQIGTGHVMRCLTLAEALKEKGSQVEFICREHKGNLISFIEAKGFKVYALLLVRSELASPIAISRESENTLNYGHWLGATQQQDASVCNVILKKINPDWLIVDHYALDETWQMALQGTYQKLMVIDDLGDRKHLCELLLDQNYGSTYEKYQALVPVHCKVFVGTKYALLRPEFAQLREVSLNRRLKLNLKTLLISMGGVDADNYTGKVLQALTQTILPKDILVTVVIGATAPHLQSVQQQAQTLSCKTEIKVNVSNMAELMANADLAIGAAGATTWERCCLGLPSIQIVIAENQKASAESLVKIDAIKLLNEMEQLSEFIKTAKKWMQSVSQTTAKICDGAGTDRVVSELLSR